MAVVFFIVICILIVLALLVFSTISFLIEKVEFSNKAKIKLDYIIHFELKILGKVRILRVSITPQKIEKIMKKFNLKERLHKINWKDLKADLPSNERTIQIVKKLDLKLEEFQLKLELGTEDVIITSFLVMLISSVLAMVLTKVIKHYEKEKYSYEIMPIYENRNVIKLMLNGKIQIKVFSIIAIIFELIKANRKEEKKNKQKDILKKKKYSYGYE